MEESTNQSPVKERLFTMASLVVLRIMVLPGFFTAEVWMLLGFLGGLIGATGYLMVHVGLIA